jgi:hypothetical protein
MIPDVHQVPFVYLPRGAYCSATGTTPCENKVFLLYLHAKAVRTSRRKKLAAEMRERITLCGRDLVKEILSRKFSIKRLTVYNNNHVLLTEGGSFSLSSFPPAGFVGRG